MTSPKPPPRVVEWDVEQPPMLPPAVAVVKENNNNNNETTPLLNGTSVSSYAQQDGDGESDSQFGADGGNSLDNNGSTSSIRTIQPLPGMKVRAHAIDRLGQFTTCSTTEALSQSTMQSTQSSTTQKSINKKKSNHDTNSGSNNLWKNRKHKKNASYWIDIDADERDVDELRDWLSQLRLNSPFLVTQLSEHVSTWSSEVIPFDSNTNALFVIRILPMHDESSDDMVHVAALCLPNLLVTFTSCPRSETGGLYALAFEYMKERMGGKLPDASSSGALLAWLQFHIERTSRALRRLRSYVLSMDASMDQNIHNVEMDEIIETKDQLLKILSVSEEQNECCDALVSVEKDTGDALDFTNLKGNLGVVLAKASATERMALRLEKHLGELRNRHEMHRQDSMNRRLAVLTVLSAVFLPLTLMTGIWGMNFEYMPELANHMAYPIALVFMVGLAIFMVLCFWRAGWFE